jgi:alanine racemase
MNRPTWAEINLGNLAFNLQSVKAFIGYGVKFMAVVKADAYGHGAIECSKKLERENIDWFGVAIPEEGVELRRAGIRKPILCFGGFWHGQEDLLLDYRITPVIFRLDLAEKFDAAARQKNVVADIHVKVDTGMNRVGVRFDEFSDFAEKLLGFNNLRVDGVMTHFANADDSSQNDFTNLQIARFKTAVETLREKGFDPTYTDLANSPGAVAHPAARNNMVRLGGILYGLGDDVLPADVEKPKLKPVLSLKSQINLLKKVPKGETIGYARTFTTERDSLIATIPLGYHDGLPRAVSNRAKAIINGHFAPIVGRISMDWTILDVTDVPDVGIGDEAILIGEKDELRIKAEALAAQANIISYELTCGINQRVTKIYKD